MRVDEFGFGFPPKLFGVKKGGTVYSINLIPFGGFVKIYGEDGDDTDKPGSFGSKSLSVRLKVITAGVAMNFLFAVFLLVLGNFFGLRIGLFDGQTVAAARDKKIQIIRVLTGSPAETAGLKILDEIIGFETDDGTMLAMGTIEEVQAYTKNNLGRKIKIIIRDGETTVKEIEARTNPPAGEGAMGIAMALTGVVSYPWYEAIWRGVYDSVVLGINTVYGYWSLLVSLFSDGKLLAEVSGPIGIAGITGQAARVGFSYLMQFVALISINLAILNIIPFPALDGGRALFIFIEKIKGSPIDRKIESAVNSVGFALLITLMIYVTIKDISRFFTT